MPGVLGAGVRQANSPMRFGLGIRERKAARKAVVFFP